LSLENPIGNGDRFETAHLGGGLSLCDLTVQLSDRLGLIHQGMICYPLIDGSLTELCLVLDLGSAIRQGPCQNGNLNVWQHRALKNSRRDRISLRQ
jgi:hypothetical protein